MQQILLVVGTLVFLHLLLLTSAKELHVHMVTFFSLFENFWLLQSCLWNPEIPIWPVSVWKFVCVWFATSLSEYLVMPVGVSASPRHSPGHQWCPLCLATQKAQACSKLLSVTVRSHQKSLKDVLMCGDLSVSLSHLLFSLSLLQTPVSLTTRCKQVDL